MPATVYSAGASPAGRTEAAPGAVQRQINHPRTAPPKATGTCSVACSAARRRGVAPNAARVAASTARAAFLNSTRLAKLAAPAKRTSAAAAAMRIRTPRTGSVSRSIKGVSAADTPAFVSG